MPNPQYGIAYSFRITLLDTLNPGRIKKSPTISAGDFKISQNNGVLTNLITLPVEVPASSGCVTVSLTSVEMSADKILILWSDPGFEWGDGSVFFDAPLTTLTSNDIASINTVVSNSNSAPLAESYAADGVAPTRDQLLFMVWSTLSQFVIDDTFIRAKRLDGITDAMVFTMNDSTIPTQRIRTS